MKISGFTIARNVVKYNYPIIESIRSILPICDEFIVNVGDSEDHTLSLIQSMRDPRIRIVQTRWDMSQGKEVLSQQTNLALAQCSGDWAFYLQSDEVIHEDDLGRLRRAMERNWDRPGVDALRFRWLHFYGSYFRYRVDQGWYQKQDRVIRNNGRIESFGDAFSFRRKDGQPLRSVPTGSFVYHYGWVHSGEVMTQRRVNAEQIGFVSLRESERRGIYQYGDLNRFPAYFGAHPKVMRAKVQAHVLSQADWKHIERTYWWHPAKIFKIRYKTGGRVKSRLDYISTV